MKEGEVITFNFSTQSTVGGRALSYMSSEDGKQYNLRGTKGLKYGDRSELEIPTINFTAKGSKKKKKKRVKERQAYHVFNVMLKEKFEHYRRYI